MELPTKRRKVKATNPHVLLIYSTPKAGKTTIIGGLEDTLIIETEPFGADYIEGMVVEATGPARFNKILKAIEAKNIELGEFAYKRIVIDTVTKLDEWSEISGTYRYMKKPQGKKFNVISGEKINHLDSRFETVHEIPQGYGYKHSREEMTGWYDKLTELAPEVILLAHVKDKFIESKSGDTVETKDINLTGKVKSIFSSRVDGIGYFYRKDDVGILSFKTSENLVCGGRCSHLTGDIIISEKQKDGSIKTFWDKIYK